MWSWLLLIFFFVAVQSSFPYPPFNEINPHSRLENAMESPELQNRRAFQSNDVIGCGIEDILSFVGLEELQELVEAMAAKRGVSPFLILRKLYRRMKNKEEIEESMINAIDGPPLPELLSHPILDLPPVIKIPPESSRAPYFLPPNIATNDVNDDDTKVVIIPVASSINRTPIMGKPEYKPRKEASHHGNNVNPLVGKLNNMLPGMFLSPVKNNQLRPPLGATVRVNPGDPLSPINRDIIVTVSPLMTLIEALRQAEIKYQNVLGVNHDTDIITFAHSVAIDCFMVDSIYDVSKNEDFGWKLTITDREGQMVYDSFCLPSGKDVLVKPGTLISLTYVPL